MDLGKGETRGGVYITFFSSVPLPASSTCKKHGAMEEEFHRSTLDR